MAAADTLNLAQVLKDVQSTSTTSRDHGFRDLKRVLNLNRHNHALRGVKEKSLLLTFEQLFQAAALERASWLKSKGNPTDASTDRLTRCAEGFRAAVEFFRPSMRTKTVKAIIGHVIQTLPMADGGFCKPMSSDYFKSLCFLFDYQAHTEHLDAGTWYDVVHFCIQSIGLLMEDDDIVPTRATSSRASIANQRTDGDSNISVLILCLRSLVVPANCPLSQNARAVSSCVCDYLRSRPRVAKAHYAAFEILDLCIVGVSNHSLRLVTQIASMSLPLIRSFWTFKEHKFRNRLLSILVRLQRHIAAHAGLAAGEELSTPIDALFETMSKAFCDNFDKDNNLTIDDLILTTRVRDAEDVMPLQIPVMALRHLSSETEYRWTTLAMIAFCANWVDAHTSALAEFRRSDSNHERSPKRRKRTSNFEDLVQQTISDNSIMKTRCRLQILTFVVAGRSLKENEIQSVMSAASQLVSHDSNEIASWAMMLLSSCAFQPNSGSESLRDQWVMLWHLCARAMSAPFHCRAACHLGHTLLRFGRVTYDDTKDLLEDFFFSSPLNGPATLCDSALALWSIVSTLRATYVSGQPGLRGYQHMLSWIRAKWSPSNFENKVYLRQLDCDLSAHALLAAFNDCLGGCHVDQLCASFTCLGSLGQAWLWSVRNRTVTDWILLFTEEKPMFPPQIMQVAFRQDSGRVADRSLQQLSHLALTYLNEEIEKADRKWTIAKEDRAGLITTDMLRSAFVLCLVGNEVAEIIMSSHSKRAEALRTKCDLFAETLIDFAAQSEDASATDMMLRTIAPLLPSLASEDVAGRILDEIKPLASVLDQLSHRFQLKNDEDDRSELEESMEWENDVGSFRPTTSQKAKADDREAHSRSEAVAGSEAFSFRVSMIAYSRLLAAMWHDSIAYGRTETIPAGFFDFLQGLPDLALLGTRSLLRHVRQSPFAIEPSHAESLMVHVGESVLPSYEWTGCELAACVILEIMSSTAALWTDCENGSISAAGADYYDWLLETALARGVCSTAGTILVSDLFFKLLRIAPEYAETLGKPSIRTTLFGLLRDADVSVQYHITQRLPSVFESFVLGKHSAIFDDIIENLPRDLGHMESICVRLTAFSSIGGTWRNLLHLSLYNIFDTVANMPEVSRNGEACVAKIVSQLGLDSGQHLFKLYSSQVLYTWLEKGSLSRIPYEIFGYEDLKTLVNDVRLELASFCVMRGDQEQSKELQDLLGESEKTIISEAFARAAAYAMASDIDKNCHDAEARLRDVLGKSLYLELLKRHFHSIVAQFFLNLEHGDDIEKSFVKKSGYEQVIKTLQKIKEASQTIASTSQSQQPSWGPTNFVDQLERLCRRLSTDPKTIWTQAMITRVSRALFSSTHHVYGPIHSCRVIQRIVLLISLAGTEVFSGMCLELLLRGLRDFCADKYTASHALPVFQYLLSNGNNSLVGHNAFMINLSLPLLLSIRGLLGSTQDSTTQESTHREMLSRAQGFRDWLCEHLDRYLAISPKDTEIQCFRKILDVARSAVNNCNGSKHTHEGRLLRTLLEETQSKNSVVGHHTSQACLQILCRDFGVPPLLEDDIIGTESEAATLTFALWKSLQFSNMAPNYLTWASRALGHAYFHNGQIDQRVASETQLQRIHSSTSSKALVGDVRLSKQRIVKLLNDQTTNSESSICGHAEAALHAILIAYEGTEDFDIVTHPLSEALIRTFLGPDRMPPIQSGLRTLPVANIQESLVRIDRDPIASWTQCCVLALLDLVDNEPILKSIRPMILQEDESFAEAVFPLVLHVVAHVHHNLDTRIIDNISRSLDLCFAKASKTTAKHVRVLLNALLYMRMQRKPREKTAFDRNRWFDVDSKQLVVAAQICDLSKTALMLLEVSQSDLMQSTNGRVSRRSSNKSPGTQALSHELIVPILKAVDEPDAFYGIEQASDLGKIAERLEYEGDDVHSLLFRGAQVDSLHRISREGQRDISSGLLPSLTKLGLNSLVNTIGAGSANDGGVGSYSDCLFTAAMKLGQWDLPTPAVAASTSSILYRVLQDLHNATSLTLLTQTVRKGMLDVQRLTKEMDVTRSGLASTLQTLASLCELDRFVGTHDPGVLDANVVSAGTPRPWMESTSIDRVSLFLTGREAFVGMLNRNMKMRDVLKLDSGQALLAEVGYNLQSARVYRLLGAQQESLSAVTYLDQLIEPLQRVGLNVDGAVKVETSHALWDRGELTGSIKTLQNLCTAGGLSQQAIPVGKADLLADLAHHVSYARLEKPVDILAHYLRPALKELQDQKSGAEAGKVFHEYATYCHNQLNNPDTLEELQRSERFKRQREAEVKDLKLALTMTSDSQEKAAITKEFGSVSKWLKIDEMEIIRLQRLRQQFLKSSLENYLRSLAASDEFDTDVIRFLAIWLAHAEDDTANAPVGEYSPQVPSRKFAPLMNQLGSRLQEFDSDFQQILGELVFRICVDHPYHSMYHIFAGSKSSGGHDSQAQSRQEAAKGIATRLTKSKRTGDIWARINRSNDLYNRMAKLRSKQIKQGAKLQMSDFAESKKIIREVPPLNVPPITLDIDIRDDRDYTQVPTVSAFRSEFSVPGGNSVPKIVTAQATDGKRYKQLFKGGLDDLRQDAIMEQVFEQVTVLLKHNKASRQRDLSIRTYKVVPLDSTSGAIEFVEPTMSLMEYLDPAHKRYYPKDLKFSDARQRLNDARDSTQSAKVKVYEEICARFNPVLRHFFFEKYEDPEDWFDRRLAYTRSTAAISILGHVLGLGDRHCQNILLDTSTGEVVHIDLGVAFEAGRILPKPETVPFRLTRDIVDGFGILQTEGVFRRCCEFTLEALRQNKDTILTLLNVLRYDPLYSWSMSPLRAKRVQDEQESRMQDEQGSTEHAKRPRKLRSGADDFQQVVVPSREKRPSQDSGEADRALGTVERKLAGGLSVSATVNELIQQATDEKNLAVLFPGWAPFA